MRMMLLLLLHMNATSASHASWLRILLPLKFGAFFRKLASSFDHCSYSEGKSSWRLK